MVTPTPTPTGTPRPGPPPVEPRPLDEARNRLAALDGSPLHEHPEQFSAIDRLLRSALDGTDSTSRR
ncbi:MAG TPA: hypothetical protein VLR26_01115 [Frankiaceae bacterium]|nr:hypothetical protein [Frankiaceae bacterium]